MIAYKKNQLTRNAMMMINLIMDYSSYIYLWCTGICLPHATESFSINKSLLFEQRFYITGDKP
jgi:hypothetical protein